MNTIHIINGPNLNLLGHREPEIYGKETLDDILSILRSKYSETTLHHTQSNAEHTLIDSIHAGKDRDDFIIINPAAFTHSSVALRDALLAVNKPFIEVHLSNIHQREAFRHHSYFSDVAIGVIAGFGAQGYELALQAAIQYLSK